MPIFIPSKEIVSMINGYIEDANTILTKVKIDADNSFDDVPSEIKFKVSGEYSNLNSKLSELISECEIVMDNIYKCASSYWALEEGSNGNIGSNIIQGLGVNSSEGLSRTDRDFFIGLSNRGKGTFDTETSIYEFTDNGKTYRYNINTGQFWLNNKKSKVVFGIYAPENATDLSNMDTITFLHGNDNEGGIYKFNPDDDIVKWCLTDGSAPSDTIMIFPQADTQTDNSNGFMNYSADVVAGTEFVKTITNQDSDCNNGLYTFSSGVKSGFKIAATDGKDTYDSVVGINGYAGYSGKTKITEEDALILNQKQVTIFSSTNDASDQGKNGPIWQNRTESIKHMSAIGLDATFYTNNNGYYNHLQTNGYEKINFLNNDPGFNGHGGGCEYAVKNLNVLHLGKF